MNKNRSKLFGKHFKTTPCWWDDVTDKYANQPQPTLSELPERIEVLVIGSGYTGLNAALQTARGGRTTLVIDAAEPGWGCSTRNGGQVSTSIKGGYKELSAKYGESRAAALISEGHQSLNYMQKLIESEQIDCHFTRAGRFLGAHSPAAYEALARTVDDEPPGLSSNAFMVSKAQMSAELNTDVYYGGKVQPHHASLHPGLYHRGLLERVMQAGASLLTNCRAMGIKKNINGYLISTNKGDIVANDVVLATNGYTETVTPWQRRRVIPIGSYIISTEEIPSEQMQQLWPTGRHICDTRRVVYYYRKSVDGKRIIFGGRVHHTECDPKTSGPLLHDEMCRIFPDLAPYKISHSWMGTVAYTFDSLPHIGQHNGIHYAMGYCGSGVGMASYLGMKLGRRLVAAEDTGTALDQLNFPTRPLYSGRPWFLAPTVRYYRWLDSRS